MKKRMRAPAALLAALLFLASCAKQAPTPEETAPPAAVSSAEELPTEGQTLQPGEEETPADAVKDAAAETEAPETEAAVPEQESPSSHADPGLAARYLEEAVEYAKTIRELYWDGDTLLSSLTPQGGTPHLWPYTEQAGMVNGILLAMDREHPDRAYFEEYLRELMEGFRRYRVKRVKMTGNETWNRPENFIAEYGTSDGSENSYAIYSSSRLDKRMDAAIVTPDAVYFDDNVWVAKEFYYAWRNLGDMAYLNEAANIMNWILGEGYEGAGALGGIYWKWSAKFRFDGGNYSDSNHASLNACSTASSAMVLGHLIPAVAGTELEGLRAGYLEKAESIFRFSTEAYVDRGTRCLYDKVFLKKGFEGQTELKKQIEKTDQSQYAYNTGTYLEAGVLLARIAREEGWDAEEYLTRVSASAAGADKKFADRSGGKGAASYPSHSWFTSFLVSGFSAAAEEDEAAEAYVESMRESLDWAWEHFRAQDGLVSPAWVKGWTRFSNNSPDSEDNPRQILYQSANAHCYAMLAQYYGK